MFPETSHSFYTKRQRSNSSHTPSESAIQDAEDFYQRCSNQILIMQNIEILADFISKNGIACNRPLREGKNIFTAAISMEYKYFQPIFDALLSYMISRQSTSPPLKVKNIFLQNNPFYLLIYTSPQKINDIDLAQKFLTLAKLIGLDSTKNLLAESITTAAKKSQMLLWSQTQRFISALESLNLNSTAEHIRQSLNKELKQRSNYNSSTSTTIPEQSFNSSSSTSAQSTYSKPVTPSHISQTPPPFPQNRFSLYTPPTSTSSGTQTSAYFRA